MPFPQIPIWRFGRAYRSLDTVALTDARTGAQLAEISQANSGIIRRDARDMGAAQQKLRGRTCDELLGICRNAGERFMSGDLPLADDGLVQSPQMYIEQLSGTTGLPHTLCRSNMKKIHNVLSKMDLILRGLTRGLSGKVFDEGSTEQAGVEVSYVALTEALGVVLPSNSPGVNSIWLPAVAMKIPVLIKPGREDPWTPMRIMQALIASGFPCEAIGFYPTDHEGAAAVLDSCGRNILFGGDATTDPYAQNPNVQRHGTGRSKVILGPDAADRWPQLLDVVLRSILDNGGRSCINASCIITPSHGDEIAEALAEKLVTVEPRPADDPAAQLAAFTNSSFAANVSQSIDGLLETAGAIDVTAQRRSGPRLCELDGLTFLLPTIIRCAAFEHPLANTEFLFPFASVVEIPIEVAPARIGPTLAATVITEDRSIVESFMACPQIDRLNIGPVPTSTVEWDQPHEGNLFEFLYRRRAIQRSMVAGSTPRPVTS